MKIPHKDQIKFTNKLMEDVIDLLNAYFIQIGVAVVPTIGIIGELELGKLGVSEIIEVTNTTLDRNLYPEGVAARTRKRDLVMKRQIVSYICKKLGYPIHHISILLKIDHATVLHGHRLVGELLFNKNSHMIMAHTEIINTLNAYHNKKYGKDIPEIIKS